MSLTAVTAVPRRTGRHVLAPRGFGGTCALAVVVALVIGTVTLVVHEWAPAPWDRFASSVATWVVVPFLLGRRLRAGGGRPRRRATLRPAALVGALALVTLDVSYYATLELLTGRTDFPATVAFWVVAAFPVGAAAGLAGALSRADGAAGAVACAVPGAVFLSEALPHGARYLFFVEGATALHAAWVVVGLVLPFVLTGWRPRRWAVTALALVAATAAASQLSTVAMWVFVRV